MSEVRTMREGNLYAIQASGAGNAWVTASGASGFLFGFVQAFTDTSAQTIETISDRGTPNHHKVVSKAAPTLQFTVLVANTAQLVPPASGSGASVPMYHLEFKQSVPEDSSITGIYAQFWGVPYEQIQFTEAERGNTQQYTCRALGMSAWNASGYIA